MGVEMKRRGNKRLPAPGAEVRLVLLNEVLEPGVRYACDQTARGPRGPAVPQCGVVKIPTEAAETGHPFFRQRPFCYRANHHE